jgi:hypothetical protein
MKFDKKRLLISRICILIKCKITILEMKYTNFYFLEEKSINERFSHISPSSGYIFKDFLISLQVRDTYLAFA